MDFNISKTFNFIKQGKNLIYNGSFKVTTVNVPLPISSVVRN